MKPTVYIETTIISYLAARPSNDLVSAGRQLLTQQWWDQQRTNYDLVTSTTVLTEIAAGDPQAAARRLALTATMTVLPIDDNTLSLAARLTAELRLPAHVFADAVHITAAALASADYLLTWNCRHIANLSLYHRIREFCDRHGLRAPDIGTPGQLMEGS